MGANKKRREELARLNDAQANRDQAMANIMGQIRTAAKAAVIALVVIWLLGVSFWQGLDSVIPLYVAGALTLAIAIVALLVRRNIAKSRELGLMMGGDAPSEANRTKLEARVAKGDAAAVLAKAQLEVQEDPKKALETLEAANLEKAPKVMANQIRATRAMIHLNRGEVKAARELAEVIDLDKAPDPKTRANLAGVVAEAWARSGNPIEASQLLDKYDPTDEDLGDVKVQLLRARAFSEAHRRKVNVMKKALKDLEAVSPQLLTVFVSQKRVHPILMQEARRRLDKAGMVPRPKIQGARR